jgi:hypothetical protein
MTDVQQPGALPAPPATPAEASTRLTALKSDPAWRDQFLAGNGPQVKEFKNLSELAAKGDDVDMAMAGVSGQSSESRLLAATAEHLREMGFPPTAIRETISGKEPTPADVERARVWKTQIMKNPEWVKRYLSGDGDAQREMLAANILLSSAKEAAA